MIGIGFTPFETRADVMVRLAIRPTSWVSTAWTSPRAGPTTPILLAEIALRTSRIGLGTRPLGLGPHAGEARARGRRLQRCSGGRFTLGIGASSPPLTEGFHGIAWERPVGGCARP